VFHTIFDSAWIGLDGAFHFTLPAYFVGVMLGFLGAAKLGYDEVEHYDDVDGRTWIDFSIWMLLIGIIGARLAHVAFDGLFWDYVHIATDPYLLEGVALPSAPECVTNAQCVQAQSRGFDIGAICNPADGLCYPQQDPFRWLKFWAGGLTIYGSLIGCTLVGWWFIRKHDLGTWRILDITGMVVPFGLFMGRLGCTGAGCCFGEVCSIDFLGIRFPEGTAAHQLHVEQYAGQLAQQASSGLAGSLPVWPTQLLSAGYSLAIFYFAYFWLRPRKRFHGQIFLTSAVLYGICRFSVEFLRADQRGELLGLATSQTLSIPVVLAAGFVLWRKLRETDELDAIVDRETGA
jgi:phosphatidylglycerol:prolipoprotein diacylglycerol transferase